MIERCALLDCELNDEPTLGEILRTGSQDQKDQANLLINKFGFKETDIFCEDCFWK